MYQVLIIDDEKPVRLAIKALGHWSELGIDQIYEAMEGAEGLACLREHRPQIVLVDMKMPNMDGAQFLDIASRNFPDSKYIVISGYDDFGYARRALLAKALDYLLKPVVEAELNESLSKAVDQLNSERLSVLTQNHLENIHHISIPLAKENLIQLLLHHEPEMPLTNEYREILQFCGTAVRYGIVIYRVINFEEIVHNKFDGHQSAANSALLEAIDEPARSWNNGFSIRHHQIMNEVIQFLALQTSEIEGELERYDATVESERIIARLNQTVCKLEKDFGFYVVAGFGRLNSELNSLSDSFNTASEILNNINLLDCKEKVFSQYEFSHNPQRLSFLDKKELLIYAFENRNLEFTRKIINEYFLHIQNSGYLSLDHLRKTVMEFLVLLENITAQFQIADGDRMVTSYLGNSRINSFTQLEDFSNAIFKAIESIFQQLPADAKAVEKEQLSEIKNYIDQHYYQQINLSLFSERYYLSKEYLSKLFKEEFGYTIYEYVLKVRMEKARELLSNPEVKVLTVSDYLGYRDNNYFSRAFKNYFGISPTEYREREFKKNPPC